MKARIFFFTVLSLFVVMSWSACKNKGGENEEAKAMYVCPMHPNEKSDKPGSKCSVCGMDLVKQDTKEGEHHDEQHEHSDTTQHQH